MVGKASGSQRRTLNKPVEYTPIFRCDSRFGDACRVHHSWSATSSTKECCRRYGTRTAAGHSFRYCSCSCGAVNAPAREQRYTVAPTPANAAATEFDPDDDNFGFNETTSFFEDAKTYDPASGTDV